MRYKKYNILPLTLDQQKLVEKHIKYAYKICMKYAELGRDRGIPQEDIEQEACMGLCIAASLFNPEKDADFVTYAFVWCKKLVLEAISNKSFTTVEDDVERLEDIRGDVAEEEDSYEAEVSRKVDRLLSILNDKERQIVCSVFGIDCEKKSFKRIAKDLDITPMRVHQIYDVAMGKLEFYNRNKNYSN